MSETKTEYGYGNAVECQEGEFEGWYHWNHDPYETRSSCGARTTDRT